MKKQLDKALRELSDIKTRLLILEQKIAMMPTVSTTIDQPFCTVSLPSNICPTCGSVNLGSVLVDPAIHSIQIDTVIGPIGQ